MLNLLSSTQYFSEKYSCLGEHGLPIFMFVPYVAQILPREWLWYVS